MGREDELSHVAGRYCIFDENNIANVLHQMEESEVSEQDYNQSTLLM